MTLQTTALTVLLAGSAAGASDPPLHGPNLNPTNMPVLMAWENWMAQAGGIQGGAETIGDNFSINEWEDFSDVVIEDSNGDPLLNLSPTGGAGGPFAAAMNNWIDAFDGDGLYDVDQDAGTPSVFVGNPRRAIGEYVLEFAIPMFPPVPDLPGTNLPDIAQSPWTVYQPSHPLHQEAEDAYRDLATAFKLMGFQQVRIRLGWEMGGDWFPWGTPARTDPNAPFTDPYEDDYKQCWAFIHDTMEAEFPELEWVWCVTTATNEYNDKLGRFPYGRVDHVSVDVYNADGFAYNADKTSESGPGMWNRASAAEKATALDRFWAKVWTGDVDDIKARFPENEWPETTQAGQQNVGVEFYYQHAETNNLPFSIGEWGVWASHVRSRTDQTDGWTETSSFGGGDDQPDFVRRAMDWFADNEVDSAVWFENYDHGSDFIDHSLLPGFWNSPQEKRRTFSPHPGDPDFGSVTQQTNPKSAQAYLEKLVSAGSPPGGTGQLDFIEDFEDGGLNWLLNGWEIVELNGNFVLSSPDPANSIRSSAVVRDGSIGTAAVTAKMRFSSAYQFGGIHALADGDSGYEMVLAPASGTELHYAEIWRNLDGVDRIQLATTTEGDPLFSAIEAAVPSFFEFFEMTVETVVENGTVTIDATINGLPLFAGVIVDSSPLRSTGELGVIVHEFNQGIQFDDFAVSFPGSVIAVRYCAPAVPNSTGSGAEVNAQGSGSASITDLSLSASSLPPGSAGFFLAATQQASVFPIPNSEGVLCLGGAIGRIAAPGQVFMADAAGHATVLLTSGAIPTPTGFASVMPGDVWHFQAWYRDANPQATSNFSDALSVTFR